MAAEYDDFPLFLSSDPLSGSSGLSSDGSSYIVNLNAPIDLQSYKGKKLISCFSASVAYTWVNISAALKNNLIVYEKAAIQYPITIDDGIYSLDSLNAYLADELLSLPATPFVANQIPFFSGVISTGFIYLVIPASSPDAISVLWGSSTLGSILGFTNPVTDAGNTLTESYFLSDTASTLGNISEAYLSVSIARGCYFGQKANSNVIASIAPGFTSVGGTIEYASQNLIWSGCNSNFIQSIYVSLLKKDGTPLAMGVNNYYDINIVIRAFHK